MDDRTFGLAEEYLSSRYLDAGRESLQSFSRVWRSVLAQRRCPEEGLSDAAIQLLLRQLALMDTNNFAAHIGAGEREGRVASALVRQRHFDLTHGIGRSGDLASEQPKAAGSSLLYCVTNALMLDLVRLAGVPSIAAAVVVPMATGMTVALVLRCVATARVREEAAKGGGVTPRFVIWPRIDQKTALKCIDAAGLTPIVVELRQAPARPSSSSPSSLPPNATTSALFLQSDVADVQSAVEACGGPAHVVCVLSTTSCFAPRLSDDALAIARYCATAGIAHVVNNAYGVQSRPVMTRIEAAQRLGRVDYMVMSGDKNFLVPVGGAVVCSCSKKKIDAAAALYAGRASASPIVDLFITALGLGRRGMRELWAERYHCRTELVRRLGVFAHDRGERLLVDPEEEGDGETKEKEEEAKRHGGQSSACEETGVVAPTPQSAESPTASTAVHASTPCNSKSSQRRKHRHKQHPRNDISLAVTMYTYTASLPYSSSFLEEHAESAAWAAARKLGAQLFRSSVTGPRVITPAPSSATSIAGCTFHNYGMHQEGTPAGPMLVMACGIGMTMADVEGVIRRLEELWPQSAASVTYHPVKVSSSLSKR